MSASEEMQLSTTNNYSKQFVYECIFIAPSVPIRNLLCGWICCCRCAYRAQQLILSPWLSSSLSIRRSSVCRRGRVPFRNPIPGWFRIYCTAKASSGGCVTHSECTFFLSGSGEEEATPACRPGSVAINYRVLLCHYISS